MQEYIKLFDTPQDADNYKIKDIPFFCYVNETEQSLVCNQNNKKLKNIDNELVINDLMFPYNFIDLGLSVKWAQYNAGVNPEDLSTAESWYGGFYAWGETETKGDYSWATYKYANGDHNKLTKYCPIDKPEYWNSEGDPDNKTVLDDVDDLYKNTLYKYFRNQYRMPTKAECEELIALPNKWVTDFKEISGLNGRIFAKTQVELDGTFNDDTMLFIPAAGGFDGSSNNMGDSSSCHLWSSSLGSDDPTGAWNLYFDPGYNNIGNDNRCLGYSVRCVSTD